MRKKLNEHQDQGIYGRAQGFVEDSEEGLESTVGQEIPIEPGQQMTAQLSISRPPIEDDEFVPGSVSELSKAAQAIAENVPADEIEWYYRQLHTLLDKATDRASGTSGDEHVQPDAPRDAGPEPKTQEEAVQRKIRGVLFDMLNEQSGTKEDEEELDNYRDTGIDYFGEEAEEELSVQSSSNDELSLEDMATEFGYSAASGMRQEILRLTDRMKYFATKIKKDDLNALMDYAAGEYLIVMEDEELLDAEDLADLKTAPAAVKSMDSFRFFFVSSFVLPAYREVAREAAKRIKAEMTDLGLPKEVHQTLINQVTGASRKKPELIKSKLDALVAKGKLKPAEVVEVQEKIRRAYAILQSVSELSDDIVQKSLDKWQATTKAKKKTLIRQALEHSSEL